MSRAFLSLFLLGRSRRTGRRAGSASKRPSALRPAIEELESRLVPSSAQLQVLGNQLVSTQTGQPVVLRGVNVGGLEGFGFAPDMVNNSAAAALDDWQANLLRLPLNQDYWLGDDPGVVAAATYQAEVDSIVNLAASRGAYVVLDLQVSDLGTSNPAKEGQYSMPDDNSAAFWASVAARYANNPTVFFDPFNEPGHFNVTWGQWKNGGTISEDGATYNSPGMQGLLNVIRGTGANNVVTAEGFNYATDFSGILGGYALSDPANNLMYEIHIYPGSAADASAADLDSLLPPALTNSYAMYIGEWGSDVNPGPEGAPQPNATIWNSNMLQWLNANSFSWTAWAMNDSPYLTDPGELTPTPYFGALVQQDLIQENGATSPPPPPVTTPPSPPVTSPAPPPANTYFAVGADAGGAPLVVVYNAATGAEVAQFLAYAPSFTGGVRVAVDDVNGDGVSDIICAAGPGGGVTQIEIVDGTMLNNQINSVIAPAALIASFNYTAPGFTGGSFIAAGTSSLGDNWVVAGAGPGGLPQVTVYTASGVLANPSAPVAQTSMFTTAQSFRGGNHVAVGDVYGTGHLDLIFGAGPGGLPQITVYNGQGVAQTSFYFTAGLFTNGVFVSGGLNGLGQFILVGGAGPGALPQMTLYNGSLLNGVLTVAPPPNAILDSFFPFPTSLTGGVRVGFSSGYGPSNGDGAVLAVPGPGFSSQVEPFDAVTSVALNAVSVAPLTGFNGGLFVAG
jgi:hypothetical protein